MCCGFKIFRQSKRKSTAIPNKLAGAFGRNIARRSSPQHAHPASTENWKMYFIGIIKALNSTPARAFVNNFTEAVLPQNIEKIFAFFFKTYKYRRVMFDFPSILPPPSVR